MNQFTRVQDRTAEEIAAAIESTDLDVSFEELIEVEDFVERIGGLANARLAVRMLERLDDEPLDAGLFDGGLLDGGLLDDSE